MLKMTYAYRSAVDAITGDKMVFARKLLDKYYSKTDLSNIYHIAMGTWFPLFV